MEVPTYFISAIKIGKKYHVILEKQQNLSEKELVKSYVKFMERAIKINPFQFFHFYDFFN
jgi:predicted LPLAT superfamily acyltransferase